MTVELDKMTEDFVKNLKELGDGLKTIDKKIDDVQKNNIRIENKVERIQSEEINLEGDKDEHDPLTEPAKFAESIENKIAAKLENKFSQENAFKAECNRLDSEAFKKFPKLLDKNSDLYKETQVILDTISPIGYDAKGKKILPPDAVLNAASRAAADQAIAGKFQIVTHEELEPGGNFQRKVKGQDITDIQSELATRFSSYGLNQERLKERTRAYNQKMRQ